MAKTILFLCTGNYYRSRFCEIYFNHLAQQNGVEWRATSKGLWQGENDNPGPISQFTVWGLKERGIVVDPTQEKFPEQPTPADFEAADLIIAVDEEEHRPMLQAQFPDWEAKTVYWLVHDVGFTNPVEALSVLEENVEQLMDETI